MPSGVSVGGMAQSACLHSHEEILISGMLHDLSKEDHISFCAWFWGNAVSGYGTRTFSRLFDNKQIMMVSSKNCVSAQKISISPGPSVGDTWRCQVMSMSQPHHMKRCNVTCSATS